ncbi:hypothetical protein [Photobacterium satsumensis]|uniref:hypothetical protein n=1 Tax=Photobacterium satsumensis TaxID=2910239 RepID=UPI003D1315E8
MKNRTFLSLHGGIYIAFAFALFFLPSQMWPMYGVKINDQYAYFLSQHTSIFLGGIAAISFFLRKIEHPETMRQLLKALVVTNLLGVLITGYAGVIGIFVGLGWSDPAFFALLTLLSYWQFSKQS